jgi:hypothetical protein
MKKTLLSGFLIIGMLPVFAEEEMGKEEMLKKHGEGSEKVAGEQDELSADVQQLVIEQTAPEVIKLLSEVEEIMVETTDYLLEPDTGGKTLAAQTEIIEKIHEAAKAKQQQSGSCESGSAMMDMMERMMGKKPGEGEGEGKEKGEGEGKGEGGEQGGDGQKGDSDEANTENGGESSEKTEERRVPKAGGKAGAGLPEEFQEALDAYNRGLEEITR